MQMGIKVLSAVIKDPLAIHQLAYGLPANAINELVSVGESTTRVCLDVFVGDCGQTNE